MLSEQAKAILKMANHEHWPQHLEEAQRALRLFAPGTRLHDVGRDATLTHADLVRDGYLVFVAGPQRYMSRLGSYYALHILASCDALYAGAGRLRIIADEFTNAPLSGLVSALTTLRAYGGEVHMISQSRSEVVRKFGEHEARTIDENSITKLWLGFSSFEEAERVSKAMGEQHAVATGLSGDTDGVKSQMNLSVIKQRWMSPAELMSMPPDQALCHVKGVGFFLVRTLGQNEIAPYCDLLADNPLEGGRLPSDPKIRLVVLKARGGRR